MRFFNKFFLIIIFFLLFSSSIKNLINYQNAQKFYQKYKENFEKEKKKNQMLKTQLLKKTSLFEVEKIIRNQLNLLQPDEVVVLIPTPTIFLTPTPTLSLPNWKKWLYLYQGKANFSRF